MSVIVLVWEMGADLGHITRLKTIADALHHKGHTVAFVLESPEQLLSLYQVNSPPPYRLIQAPAWTRKKVKLTRNPVNLSELLLANGYHNSKALTQQISLWQQTLQRLQPDILIFDYAPTAILASRDLDCKTISLDNSFSAPPNIHPLPAYDKQQSISHGNLCASDKKLISAVNESLNALNITPIEFVYQLFESQKHFLLTVSELDPHSALRDHAEYIGPISNAYEQHKKLAWRDETNTPKIYGYLKLNYPQLQDLLETLNRYTVEAKLFIPNAPQEFIDRHSNGKIEISRLPFDLSEGLDRADFVICHGGHTTTLQSLLAGTPILFIPLQQEQLLTAKQCIKNGLGVGLGAIVDKNKIAISVEALLSSSTHKHAAVEFKNRHAVLLKQSALNKVLKYIEDTEKSV